MEFEWWILKHRKDEELEVAAYAVEDDQWVFIACVDGPSDKEVQKHYEKIKLLNLEKLAEDE
jgi:hypothetical protein